jgi:hypothetical protein
MTQILEEATFETLALRSSRCGKFENIESSPLLLAHTCMAPFGVELDSVYHPLPIFAGGSDPRKHLTLQLELPEAAAAGLRALDEACVALSGSAGWSPLVTLKDDRWFVKVKLLLEGARATNFRVGEGELQHGWEQLGPLLEQHNNLRGASLKAALRPMYIWNVSGKRGIALGLEQIVVTPAAPRATIDHFL